jgi:hypothetical protein
MPDYASLSTQIDAVKDEITASLTNSSYTAQDLVFIASALDKLGTLLGVNDIVAVTNTNLATINSTGTTNNNTLNSTYETNLAGINTASSMVIRTESTTSRTLTALTDTNQTILCSNSGATTITVPTNASQAFPTGSMVEIIQYGTGQVTIAAAGGVTIRQVDGLSKTRVQYSSVSLQKIGTDEWILNGDLGV